MKIIIHKISNDRFTIIGEKREISDIYKLLKERGSSVKIHYRELSLKKEDLLVVLDAIGESLTQY